jgi:hypothetical protein
MRLELTLPDFASVESIGRSPKPHEQENPVTLPIGLDSPTCTLPEFDPLQMCRRFPFAARKCLFKPYR